MGEVAREYLGFTFLASFRAALLAVDRRYDVVHVNNPPDFLIVSAFVPKLLGARVIFDVHDLAPDMFAMRFGRRPAARLGGPRAAPRRASGNQLRGCGRHGSRALSPRARLARGGAGEDHRRHEHRR